MLLSLLLSAHAATCDMKALTASFDAASPAGSGKVFAEMAACDPAAAKAFAPTAFKKILSGEGGDAAMIAAISIGAPEIVRGWVLTREPDERSSVMKMLGASCDKTGVPAFFTGTAKEIGDKFWTEGWYTGLASCRDPGVQELLRGALATRGADRARYYSILGIFAQNLGKNAIPFLRSQLEKETDPEVATNMVGAFADAAGSDAEARATAITTIVELAPRLPEQAVNQARITLGGWGAEAEADALAAVRYKSVAQANGTLLYGLVVVDSATCKNGDVKVEVHVAQVAEPGRTWPDQLQERVKASVETHFSLGAAARCKGTGKVEYRSSPAPFKDAAAFKAWVEEELKAVEKSFSGVKLKRIDEDQIVL